MFFRLLIAMILAAVSGAYAAVRNVPEAQAFVATVLAIVRQDPDALFPAQPESGATNRHRQVQLPSAATRPGGVASGTSGPAEGARAGTGPRDFTLRNRPPTSSFSGTPPTAPRLGD